MNWLIPLADIDFGEAEEKMVMKVLRSRWLTMGDMTHEFEKQFAEYVGSKHAFAVANCTAALHLACLATELKPEDEIIVPSFTFVATVNAIRYVGATPVFADIESDSCLSLSAETIARCITPRTRGIVVMHYGGFPCNMPKIMELAKQHNLIIIEDAAHAIGSALDGIKLGVWGNIGCFSFFSNKNMTTGEGGMIVTNDDALAEKIRVFRSHGMTTLTWDRHKGHASSYDVTELGYNYRIDEIRSALGLVQLNKLDSNNLSRKKLNIIYQNALLELVPTVGIPYLNYIGESSFHIRPILLPENIDRTTFMDLMKSAGIQTSIHYPPVHKFKAYKGMFESTNLPITEEVSAREVTLPLFPAMTEEQVLMVVKKVRESIAEI